MRIEDGEYVYSCWRGKKALLIDSGKNTPHAKEIAESITTLPIELLNTHADRIIFRERKLRIRIYVSDEEEYYRSRGGTGTIIPVQDNDILDLGNRPLKIISIPGHTPGSVAILDIHNRVLIGGDSVQDGNIFMFKKHRNMSLYVESLKKLLHYEDEFDVIYPSHGTFPVYPEIIKNLIEGAEQIIKGTAEGKVVDMFGTLAMLYKFPYAGFLCDIRIMLESIP